MAPHNNLNLFYLLLFSLLLPSASSPRPILGPGPSPSSPNYVDDETDYQEYDVAILSMLPTADAPSNSIQFDFPPTLAPSADVDDETDYQEYDVAILSILPTADAPSHSKTTIQFDFPPTLAPSAYVDPQLKEICDTTDYPSLCLATVVPYLNGETKVSSVLDVTIQISAQLAKYGQTTAHKLAGNPGNTPQLAAVLNECSGGFAKAVDNYQKASEAMPEHDKSTLNTMLSGIISVVGDCRDANSQDSKLYNICDRLIKMTINSLAISALMV